MFARTLFTGVKGRSTSPFRSLPTGFADFRRELERVVPTNPLPVVRFIGLIEEARAAAAASSTPIRF
jgi:hypothetical protein